MSWKYITLSGTFMNKDTALFEFEVYRDMPVRFTCLCEDKSLFPWEMRERVNGYALVETLWSRVTPPTRQGIDKAMQDLGFPGYDVSEILKFSNANCWEDTFWVRFPTGPQTWKEVRQKAGFTTY